MDGNITKALWLGVTVLLFVAVATIGITLFNGMRDIGDESGVRIDAIAASLASDAYRAYDGKQVNGDDILTAISTFGSNSGEFIVLVDTLGDGSSVTLNPDLSAPPLSSFAQYISNTTRSLIIEDRCFVFASGSGLIFESQSRKLQDAARRDAENSNLQSRYINPSGRFLAHLIYDSNQKVCGAIFSQVE